MKRFVIKGKKYHKGKYIDVADEKAEFWSIYSIERDGGESFAFDANTKQDANDLVEQWTKSEKKSFDQWGEDV